MRFAALCAIMFPSAVIARGETALGPQTVWIETEVFDEKGGWVVDQQYMDIMGSPSHWLTGAILKTA